MSEALVSRSDQDAADRAEAIIEAFAREILGQPWRLRANCMGVDPDMFFPERGASMQEAKEVCRGCPVREDCLEFAITHNEKFGIWCGTSERERRRIRRARLLGQQGIAAAQ